MIYVCSLSKIEQTVAATGAGWMLSLLAEGTPLARPAAIPSERHLYLSMHDIAEAQDRADPAGGRPCAGGSRLRPRLGPQAAAYRALLRGNKPVDGKRLYNCRGAGAAPRRNRTGRDAAAAFAIGHAQSAADCPCGSNAWAGTTAWSRRSVRSAAAQTPSRVSLSAWTSRRRSDSAASFPSPTLLPAGHLPARMTQPQTGQSIAPKSGTRFSAKAMRKQRLNQRARFQDSKGSEDFKFGHVALDWSHEPARQHFASQGAHRSFGLPA